MAQAAVVGMTAATVTGTGTGAGPAGGAEAGLLASLTSDEIRELREYEKLLRFRDEVVNGLHPRIKPAHLAGRTAQGPKQSPTPAAAASTASATSQPTATNAAAVIHERAVTVNAQAQQANQRATMASSVPGLGTLSGASGGPKPLAAGKPEIDPVLLEKSDGLVRAEMQLKRQRLERDLKEQLEQRRKAPEQLPELDVADIYAKALSAVHATPARSTDDTAANASASSDSFDDNSFYSSRHDTPESNMASRLPNESEDEELREGSPYEPELDPEPVVPVGQAQPAALPPSEPIPPSGPSQQRPQPIAVAAPGVPTAPKVVVPGLSIGASVSTKPPAQPAVPVASGALESGSEESATTGTDQASNAQDLRWVNERLLNREALARNPSPLVRAHDLSPVAPQPTHVVPPALARQSHLAATDSSGTRATPAQVAALRKQPSNGSSPESSPQGNGRAEKKKNKKKKRKVDRLAAESAAATPYIKPEPRSPSPLTSPQFSRPSKRQRRSPQQPVDLIDDEPRYEQRIAGDESYQERYQPRIVRQERVVGYERGDVYRPHHGDEPVLVASPRYERVYYDDYRAPPEPAGTMQYVREVRTVRPGPRVVEAGSYEDGATYYRDVRAASRMSVRPAAVYPRRSLSPVMREHPPAAMPPPKRRIVVDEFGREYLEPVRPATVVREDVVSDPRGYERILPPRALSRRPEAVADDAILYRPASPAYGVSRRVITQPEYSMSDYRGGYREATGNPMPPAPPHEYHPSRPITSEREPLPPREYLDRAASARPPPPPPPPPPPYYYAHPAGAGGSIIRAASARPVEAGGGIRYEPVHASYEGDYHPPPPPPALRSASVRPAAEAAGTTPARYDYGDYGAGARAYHGQQHQPEGRREVAMMPPPPQMGGASGGGGARAWSAVPAEVVRRDYPPPQGQGQPVERYYGRPPPPPPPPPPHAGREDEDVVFLERVPRDGGYREMR